MSWKHGTMSVGPTSEIIARKAAAMFVCLWLRGFSASFADKLMDGFICFLERQEASIPEPTCQTCGGDRLMPMLSRVPGDQRLKIGKRLGITYSLGPGSGIELPMNICPDCGMIQSDRPLE